MSAHSHAQRMQFLQQQQRAAHAHSQAQTQSHYNRQPQPQPHYSQSSHSQRPVSHPSQQRSTPNASIQSYPVTPTGSQVSGSIPQQQGSRSGYSGQQQTPYRPQRPSSGSGYRHDVPPSYDDHYRHSRPSSTGARSYSRSSMGSNPHHSRSLGASKASLATYRSGKSSIQHEYHDRRVRSQLSSMHVGRARTPFLLAILFFILGVLVFFTGFAITICRSLGIFYAPVDGADAIGPIILCIGILLVCLGVKFILDAYKISAKERRRFRFTARGESAVSVNTVSSRVPDPGEQLASGSATQNAITRTPVGSRSTLTAV